MVYGGHEAKCVSPEWEKHIGEKLGRVCPRVDLPGELTAVAEVIEFAISERMRPLLALRAEAVAGAYDMTAEELNELLSLVSAVLNHRDIVGILEPEA